jgi:ubiquinone biosynthesis protein UbiJ
MTASPAWLAAVEAMLNRNLDESSQAAAVARHLEGRSLRVDIASLTSIRAAVRSGRVLLSSDISETADAVVSGSAIALWNLFRADVSHPIRGVPAGGAAGARDQSPPATVQGDAEVANRFRELFKFTRPDLETEVSRLLGEIPARGLARFAQTARQWSARAVASARANVSEYLQEESRDLVNRTELEEFLRGVDQAREAADRAEARLAQLERRIRARS